MADRPRNSSSGKGPKKPGQGFKKGKPKAPTTPTRTINADRVRALRKNRADAIAHAKDMTRRMGVEPVARKSVEDGERLHVRIAHSGLCSRRAAEKLILEGRVTVNGDIVAEMGIKVSDDDEIRVDGQLCVRAKTYTVMLNKPTGVVTTLSDPQGRPTIVKFLPQYGVQLKPVGRLDMDTEGLLICTNDGDLALRLAHDDIWRAPCDEFDKAIQKLCDGVFVDGRKTLPARVDIIHQEAKSNTTGLRITIHEGRKRQVRLMCEYVGHPVISLKRVRYGPLYVKGMRPGECRLLGKKEVDELKRMVGIPV